MPTTEGETGQDTAQTFGGVRRSPGRTVGRMVPMASIEPDPDQPRRDLGSLDGLTASIRSRGVLEPILARPVSRVGPDGTTTERRYRIISGERRFRAAGRAGLREIPLIEMDVSPRDALEIALVENLQRADLTPFEEAEGLRTLVERHGYTHDRAAGAVGRSRVSVTESLGLLRMPRTVRETAIELGVAATKSILLEVMKLDTEASMIRMLERIAEFGLTRAEVRAEIRKRRSVTVEDEERRTTEAVDAPKPYVFRFRSVDDRFSVSLSFRQEVVEEKDLIVALEELLAELRRGRDAPTVP
ncbi:MAG: ParB/RepB/Spo0J family partition protein [Holophagales bacterium]|nr:ParB/RepB/Spo0J family partition protein [Holophagales bacterium]MYF95817.1 ParB/RepB/Spo0J family partition protein [Holophagales bacterium]